MSQIPPPVYPPQNVQQGYAYPPPRQRTNGLAIGSLICGILGCVPFITSLVAILLGILGLRKTKDPAVGGKALAIVGLVLGVLGVLGWGLLSGVLGTAYIASKPARVVANQFAMDLSTGNLNAAAANTTGIKPEELTATLETMKAWGTLKDTTFFASNTSATLNGPTTCELVGSAVFTTGGQKVYTAKLVKPPGGTFKVESYEFK